MHRDARAALAAFFGALEAAEAVTKAYGLRAPR